MKNKVLKVVVALSGGVDSAVAAALLLEQKRRFNVEGIFMETGFGGAQKYAQAVADKLGIPLRVLDLRQEFKKRVVDYFLAEIKAGRTPNPCVVCNGEIKFGLLFDEVLKMGADFFATGHYVRLRKGRDGKMQILEGKDKIKDQSYFLYRLPPERLSQIIFPLGDYKKSDVLKMAEKEQLPCRSEQSFDLCFTQGDIKKFIAKNLKTQPGKIVDLGGKVLGEHQGLAFYTIGQRASLGGPGPFYIVKKDLKKNLLVVSSEEKDLLVREIFMGKVFWVIGEKPKLPMLVKIKMRYGGKAEQAILSVAGSGLKAVFKKNQKAPAFGQSAVFYKGKQLLGGGVQIEYGSGFPARNALRSMAGGPLSLASIRRSGWE